MDFTQVLDVFGSGLEWLTKYGLIDIFFGLGILAYIRRKLQKSSVHSIDGIEIIPKIEPLEGIIEIKVRNLSKEPLYIYRAYFKPGYPGPSIDLSSARSFAQSWFYSLSVNRVETPAFRQAVLTPQLDGLKKP